MKLVSQNTQMNDDVFTLNDLIRIVSKNKGIIISVVAFSLMVALVRYFVFPSYQGNVILQVRSGEGDPVQAISGKFAGAKNFLSTQKRDTYLDALSSHGFYIEASEQILTNPDLSDLRSLVKKAQLAFASNAGKNEAIELSKTLADWVTFNSQESQGILITVRAKNKKLTYELLDYFGNFAREKTIEFERQELQEIVAFVESNLNSTEDKIHELNDKISFIKKKKGSEVLGNIQGRIAETVRDLDQNRIDMDVAKKILNHFKTGKYSRAPSSQKDQRIEQVIKEIDYLDVRQASLKTKLRELTLRRDYVTEEELDNMERALSSARALYEELKKQKMLIEMKEVGARQNVKLAAIHILDITRHPSILVVILFAIIIGLFVTIPFVAILEKSWPRIRGLDNAQEMGFTPIGQLPDMTKVCHKLNSKYDPNRLCDFETSNVESVPYTQLRSRILSLSQEMPNGAQVIAFLSSEIGDGKSHVSRNLAASIAHLKERVLLIDCDLYWKSSSEFFGFEKDLGLSDVLTNKVKFGSVLKRRLATGLDFVPAGSRVREIQKLFNGIQFPRLISDLRSLYDVIILDVPVVTLSPEAEKMTRLADMKIMVAAENKTHRKSLELGHDLVVDGDHSEVHLILNRAAPNMRILNQTQEIERFAARLKEKEGRIRVASR